MLCSGEELRLTGRRRRDPDPARPTRRSGVPLADLYGDDVLDVDVKPNRGDALSILGLAREVAAATGAPGPLAGVRGRGGERPVDRRAARRRRARSRPVHRGSSAAGSSGVTVGPSPDRVQMRLLAAGQRPIINVVDASNYVMLELGKPIHTFDAGAVARRARRPRHDRRPSRARRGAARDARPRRARAHARDAAHRRPRRARSASPGVMGGATSEVSDATTDVVDRVGDLRPGEHPPDGAAARAALRGEQPVREGPGVRGWRGSAPTGPRSCPASGRAAWSRRGRVDTAPDEPGPSRVTFRPARINRLLGTELVGRRAAGAPARVGVETEAPRPASR